MIQNRMQHPINAEEAKKGFTILELILVIIVISVLFVISIRVVDSTLDMWRYKSTIEEMRELSKGLVGDETLIRGGKRVDFGYLGDQGGLPGGLAAFQNATTAKFFNSTHYYTDGWGRDYLYTRDATRARIISRAADGTAGGTGVNEDITLDIPRSIYEQNRLYIACKDGRGNLLRGNDGATEFHVRRIALRRILRDKTTVLSDSYPTGAITYANGMFVATNVTAGNYQIRAFPANGTGGANGNYDWRPYLNDGQSTHYSEIVVYPKGPSRWNYAEILFPGTVNKS